MTLNIFLLGVPRLEVDNQVTEIDTRKAVAILAYMALAEERPTRDFLATFLWPEFDQSRARAALRRTLSAMRRDLGKVYFDISREAVSFSTKAECQVDVLVFQEMAKAEGVENWETAVSLYRDDFMAGFTLRDSPEFDEWQYFLGEQLRRTLSDVLQKLIDHYRGRAAWDKAIHHARHWLALDPLREEAHRSLMALLAWAGERANALRQYRDCIRILDEELGVAPLAETTDLYHAIQENYLDPPAQPSAPPETEYEPAQPVSDRTASLQIPLVGRERALQSLDEHYRRVESGGETGNGRFVIITGEAGIGKTRLAEEFLTAQRSKPVPVLLARCYEGEQGLAYGPVVSALRQAIGRRHDLPVPEHWRQEISRLLPELSDSSDLPPLDGPGALTRFFDAICQSFVALLDGGKRGILCFDDLQWADQATLDLLVYLARRLPGLALFVLGTWRTPDTFQEVSIRQLQTTGQRLGIGRFLELERLTEGDVEELLHQLDRPPGIAAQLFNKSEGLPFFLNAYLTQQDAGEAWPDSFRDLLFTRLAAVDQTGQQLLQTASVIGRSFDYDTLRIASGRSDDETVQAIETLLAHGLIIDSAATAVETMSSPQYDFSHQALRDLVYEETSFARRRLLHRRVADSLSQYRGRSADSIAAQIAFHFQAAGQEAEAARYFYQAGNYARQLYANTEALNHYQSALALNHPDAAELDEAIGDLKKLVGAYGAALAAYEKAAALAETADLPRLEQKLGGVYHRHGDWERAVHHFSAALNTLPAEDGPARARVLADWSRTAHRAGDGSKAKALAEEALTLAETSEDLSALTQTHNILGMLARAEGDFENANHHLQRSLTLADKLNRASIQMAALNNLSLLARDQAEFSRAESLLTDALALCRKLGDRHREAALLNNLADLYHMAGDDESAHAHVRQSVTILAEIGTDTAEWQPEIWKLTEW